MNKAFSLEPVLFPEIEARLLQRGLNREAFDALSQQSLEELRKASLDRDLYFASFFDGDIGYASRKSRLRVKDKECEYKQIGRKYPGRPYKPAPEEWALSERCLPHEDYRTTILRAILQEAERSVSRTAVTVIKGPDRMDLHPSTAWWSLWSFTTWHLCETTPEVVGFTKEVEILDDSGVEIHLQRFPIIKAPVKAKKEE